MEGEYTTRGRWEMDGREGRVGGPERRGQIAVEKAGVGREMKLEAQRINKKIGYAGGRGQGVNKHRRDLQSTTIPPMSLTKGRHRDLHSS